MSRVKFFCHLWLEFLVSRLFWRKWSESFAGITTCFGKFEIFMSHLSDIYVTAMSHLCRICVSFMWHLCHIYVEFMSYSCHIDVVFMSHSCRIYVTFMSHLCHIHVSFMSHVSDMYVTSMSHLCHIHVTFMSRVSGIYLIFMDREIYATESSWCEVIQATFPEHTTVGMLTHQSWKIRSEREREGGGITERPWQMAK